MFVIEKQKLYADWFSQLTVETHVRRCKCGNPQVPKQYLDKLIITMHARSALQKDKKAILDGNILALTIKLLLLFFICLLWLVITTSNALRFKSESMKIEKEWR